MALILKGLDMAADRQSTGPTNIHPRVYELRNFKYLVICQYLVPELDAFVPRSLCVS